MSDEKLYHDPTTNQVYQTEFYTEPETESVKITVEDDGMASNTYALTVSFTCTEIEEAYVAPFDVGAFIGNQTESGVKPIAKIGKITFGGLMDISFDQVMRVPDDLSVFKNDTVMIDGDELPIMTVLIQPGPDSLEENLGFTWEVSDFTPQTLRIQLTFEKPIYVST